MADNEQPQAAPKGGKMKIIILIAVIVLIAVGVSVGVTLYLLGGDSETESTAEAETAAPALPAPAQYFEFDRPFVVTLNAEGRQRYLQVFVALLAREPTVLAAVELHNPVLRNRLLSLFGQQDFLALQTEEGRLALQTATLEAINEILAKESAGSIEQVLFTNFVMQ
ncbi:MAG: flagellar basal body-associated FliL family protein [Gammaproteobacteria bacterium]|nr:flagellar basal body-associated FliL family protein [Gammaproteobacteria bacterium]